MSSLQMDIIKSKFMYCKTNKDFYYFQELIAKNIHMRKFYKEKLKHLYYT